MDIKYQAHHAVISEQMQKRAERIVLKIARRLHEAATEAVVRFERDSGDCRVELQLNAPRHRPYVAEGRGRYYGPALSIAARRLEAQLPVKDTPKTRTRERARMIGRV